MKKTIVLCLGSMLLAGCSPELSVQLQDRLENPLYAEQYYDLLLDRMVDLKIREDPILKDSAKAAVIEDTRLSALMRTKEANTAQREGMLGAFVPGTAGEVHGEALLTESALYLGPTFEAYPGPSLHVLLTTVVDPREGTFPDPTSVDLGAIEDPFGAQTLAVPKLENETAYRTVVIWDTKLERVYGFAQLAK